MKAILQLKLMLNVSRIIERRCGNFHYQIVKRALQTCRTVVEAQNFLYLQTCNLSQTEHNRRRLPMKAILQLKLMLNVSRNNYTTLIYYCKLFFIFLFVYNAAKFIRARNTAFIERRCGNFHYQIVKRDWAAFLRARSWLQNIIALSAFEFCGFACEVQY